MKRLLFSRGVIRWVLLALLLSTTAIVRAEDYTYVTNIGAIAITGYIGSGGDVVIPDIINGLPVTSIEDSAFLFRSNLTGIAMPNSVTNIGRAAFGECTSLTSITLPTNVTTVGDLAFTDCKLSSVRIPDGVTHIGLGTFGGCIALTNITIPNSITTIGESAFESCASLPGVTIPSSVTNIGNEAFYSCTSLGNVTIPNNVTSIGSWAFGTCTGLTSVTIGGGVTNIGSHAFEGCASLAEITVDALNPAFSSVAGVIFDESQTTLILCPGGKVGGYTIPNSVIRIADYAFSGCTSLSAVALPSSVTNIGNYVFWYCSSLTAITVDVLNPAYRSVDGVLFNKSQTTLITCPGGKIGIYAISNGVVHIGSGAFATCSYLTSVSIPNSTTDIRDRAFATCTSLRSLTIPGSVTNIGDFAFWNCTNLLEFHFNGDAPSVGGGAFSGFSGSPNATAYFLPGTTGWGLTFAGLPAVLWNPQEQKIGVQANQFAFTITGSSNLVVVVEVCANLSNPTWAPVGTNLLVGGSSYFSDPGWSSHPSRFYRLSWQ